MNQLSIPDTGTVSVPAFAPQRAAGVTVTVNPPTTPLDYFFVMFDTDMIDEICLNSNNYAELHKDKYPFSYKSYPDEG